MSKEYFRTIYQIIKTGHRITDQVSMHLKPYGATEPQYNVLRILRFHPEGPLTVKEIQDQMVQRSSNVSRIIDKLLAKGYVIRKECPTNRRKMDISLTEEGADFLKTLDRALQKLHHPWQHNLNTEELQQLRALIEKLTTVENEA
ncbi:MAG: MarR family transcriptional regulator [Bacteroidota bacterium]